LFLLVLVSRCKHPNAHALLHRKQITTGLAFASSQVVGRAAALFLLGMFLQGGVPGHFATFDLATVRVMGILQRIARARSYLSIDVSPVTGSHDPDVPPDRIPEDGKCCV